MKKLLSVFLISCILFSLSVSALAWEEDPDGPLRWMFDTTGEWEAAMVLWQAEKAAQALDLEPEPEPEPESEPEPSPPIESVGTNHDNSSAVPVDTGVSDKYPVGSYVDASGDVWSPDGALLSPPSVPALSAAESNALSPDVSDTPDTSAPVTPEAGAPVYYVSDLRPAADASGAPLSGLKALVSSIFGEYTPVTTTSVVTETAGSEVSQYLVETVAPGAAGVDYEWLAGVFLFGILLFCFMKLLGGVLK